MDQTEHTDSFLVNVIRVVRVIRGYRNSVTSSPIA
jgi:hypothetical protein